MLNALFLDRDGVINVDKDYLFEIEQFEFIDGIFNLCKYFINRGYVIIVVTNQSGIARGYYSSLQFNKLTAWMNLEFKKNGIDILHVYFCPHHPEISGECRCRKPKPGMLYSARDEYDIDLKHSLLIGDKERDIEAAITAGVTTTYLFNQNNDVKSSKATKIIQSFNEIMDMN